MNKKVRRGDIWFVRDLGNAVGHEMKKNRPAIIVSNDTNNEHSDCLEVVYLTTTPGKRYTLPTHVSIKSADAKYSIALCESIYTVDSSRLMHRIGKCTTEEMNNVNKAVYISLGLEEPTTKFINLNTMNFETGNNETLIKTAEIICEINKMGGKINEVDKILNGDAPSYYGDLENVLPREKIDELYLLMMIKVEEEKKAAIEELNRIIRVVNDKTLDVGKKEIVYISQASSKDSGSNNKDSGDDSNTSNVEVESKGEKKVTGKCATGKKKKSTGLKKELRMRVNDLIRDGKDNQEIADIVGITSKAAGDYRYRFNKGLKEENKIRNPK